MSILLDLVPSSNITNLSGWSCYSLSEPQLDLRGNWHHPLVEYGWANKIFCQRTNLLQRGGLTLRSQRTMAALHDVFSEPKTNSFRKLRLIFKHKLFHLNCIWTGPFCMNHDNTTKADVTVVFNVVSLASSRCPVTGQHWRRANPAEDACSAITSWHELAYFGRELVGMLKDGLGWE